MCYVHATLPSRSLSLFLVHSPSLCFAALALQLHVETSFGVLHPGQALAAQGASAQSLLTCLLHQQQPKLQPGLLMLLMLLLLLLLLLVVVVMVWV
jgi:hypothetical protein